MNIPKYVSVTDLCSYSFCPRALYFRKVQGLKKPANKAMFLGSMKHKVFEVVSSVEDNVIADFSKNLSKNDFLSSFLTSATLNLKDIFIKNNKGFDELDVDLSSSFTSAKDILTKEVQSRVESIHDFAVSNDVFGEELKEKLMPKIFSEVRVSSENLRLRGIIDRIVQKQSSVFPVEFKSGKHPLSGVWDSHRLQIASYCLLLSETPSFKGNIDGGVVSYIDSDVSRNVPFNEFLKSSVLSRINDVYGLFDLDEAPSCGGKSSCDCGDFV